jgi:hypothetical protein
MPVIALILLLVAGVAPPQPPKARSSGPPDVKTIPVPESRLKKRIPSSMWSRAGWNTFRWGMGPEDVADRLRDQHGGFRSADWECKTTTPWTFAVSCWVDDHAFAILDFRPMMDFAFIDGRLAEVTFSFYPTGRKFLAREEGETLFKQLHDLLEKEFGPPQHEFDTPPTTAPSGVQVNSKHADWDTPFSFRPNPDSRGFEVHLSAWLIKLPRVAGGKANVDLVYSEERYSDHFNGRARGDPPASESEKLRGVSPTH